MKTYFIEKTRILLKRVPKPLPHFSLLFALNNAKRRDIKEQWIYHNLL
jgi:hypothetical protein